MSFQGTGRREFLAGSLAAMAAAGAARLHGNENPSSETLCGSAEHVISIWLGGGMGQIDTFDPKRKGDAKSQGTWIVLQQHRHCRARRAIV
jgi:hypothetical protein